MVSNPIYSVVEDNAGGLTLFVFSDLARSKVIFAHTGYQYDDMQGRLVEDLAALQADITSVAEWEGNDEQGQAMWDGLDVQSYGWKVVANEHGPIAAEKMGVAARREFYPGFAP